MHSYNQPLTNGQASAASESPPLLLDLMHEDWGAAVVNMDEIEETLGLALTTTSASSLGRVTKAKFAEACAVRWFTAYFMVWCNVGLKSALLTALVNNHIQREFRTNQQQQRPFYGPLSGTTRMSRYQKKHSPTHHPDHHPIFITFFHLPRSIASSLFKLRAWQSFCTTSFHVLFGLPLGLEPSTSYFIL